jgi:hypothetical protein
VHTTKGFSDQFFSTKSIILYSDSLHQAKHQLQATCCWSLIQSKYFWRTYYMKIIFWSGTTKLGLAQYVNQFLVWHKKFGPAQNV